MSYHNDQYTFMKCLNSVPGISSKEKNEMLIHEHVYIQTKDVSNKISHA